MEYGFHRYRLPKQVRREIIRLAQGQRVVRNYMGSELSLGFSCQACRQLARPAVVIQAVLIMAAWHSFTYLLSAPVESVLDSRTQVRYTYTRTHTNACTHACTHTHIYDESPSNS